MYLVSPFQDKSSIEKQPLIKTWFIIQKKLVILPAKK